MRGSRWARRDTWAFWLITLGAAALRLIRLDIPSDIMFDERYYAKDSCWYVLASESACQLEGPQAEVHPPLAKWLMAVGIRIFGFDAFGWRIVAALAGIITVSLTYLLARRLLGSTIGASIASGLLAIDFLHFVQSRISMLEIFVPLFGVAAVLFAVYDRDRLTDARAGPSGVGTAGDARAGPVDAAPDEVVHELAQPDHTASEQAAHERAGSAGAAALEALTDSGNGGEDETVLRHRGGWIRPWRLAAGLAAGAAIASKWSGVAFLLVVVALTLIWETSARREEGDESPLARVFREEGASLVIAFVVAPLVLYAVTHIGRVEGDFFAWPWSDGSWLRTLWERQFYFADFHHELDASHPYQSPAWSWLLLRRPVAYFFETQPDGDYREILGTGNPFVWWTSLVALAAATVTVRRRRNAWGPELVIVAGFALTYLPWFALTMGRDAVFLFYVLPSLPFMCLALGWVATVLGKSWEARATIAIFTAAALGLFAFYYPVLANVPIPRLSWEKRIWIFEDCKRPAAETEDEDPPPSGWCWI